MIALKSKNQELQERAFSSFLSLFNKVERELINENSLSSELYSEIKEVIGILISLDQNFSNLSEQISLLRALLIRLGHAARNCFEEELIEIRGLKNTIVIKQKEFI